MSATIMCLSADGVVIRVQHQTNILSIIQTYILEGCPHPCVLFPSLAPSKYFCTSKRGAGTDSQTLCLLHSTRQYAQHWGPLSPAGKDCKWHEKGKIMFFYFTTTVLLECLVSQGIQIWHYGVCMPNMVFPIAENNQVTGLGKGKNCCRLPVRQFNQRGVQPPKHSYLHNL